jgi:hypothetical protein
LKPVRTLRLGGKRYRLRYVNRLGKCGKGNDGDCDAPATPGKAVRIRTGLSPKRELTVLIHEMRHAQDWRADEAAIVAESEELGDNLWRLDYRKTYIDPATGERQIAE